MDGGSSHVVLCARRHHLHGRYVVSEVLRDNHDFLASRGVVYPG
jgi:hypothetical protein